MKCPRCGKTICDCLLEDPGFLARAVGKQLSRLGSGEAPGLSTTKSDTSGSQEMPDTAAQCARTHRHEEPDGKEFDETAAENIEQVECPYCGRSFPIQHH
jgi:hypothetical protein